MRAENMYRGGQGKNVKGKNQYIPGMPKKKAQQHPIDESGPPIKVPKVKKNYSTTIENEKTKEVVDWLNGWNTPAAQEVIKQQLVQRPPHGPTEEQELLLAVHREIWKDTVFQKCSHGLMTNIKEYLQKNKLI